MWLGDTRRMDEKKRARRVVKLLGVTARHLAFCPLQAKGLAGKVGKRKRRSLGRILISKMHRNELLGIASGEMKPMRNRRFENRDLLRVDLLPTSDKKGILRSG
jgi:hypothetical protein